MGTETHLIGRMIWKVTAGKWEGNKGLLEVYPLLYFLQTLPLSLLWRNVFPETFMVGEVLSSRVETFTKRLTAFTAQYVTACRNQRTGMSQVSGSVFVASDQECLQVSPEGLTQVLSFWSPGSRCSCVIVLLWRLGVCLFIEINSREPWRRRFPLPCPFALSQGGHGCHFYKDSTGGEDM